MSVCLSVCLSLCLSVGSHIWTRSSATADGPRDALCQLKSCQLLNRCTKNHTWKACSRKWPWKSLKVIKIASIRQAIYHFLLVVCMLGLYIAYLYAKFDNSSFSRSRNMFGAYQNLMVYVTWLLPFQGWFAIRGLALATINLCYVPNLKSLSLPTTKIRKAI